ncbi:hypothetical protein [uncultured Alistipes sp.]|uniref:hypothetical protein n=1 Tax=uncultured Alistipes sp. TaxID=538949 RepID=UPI002603F49B|nr:hypothetical protein [uncultured Alistipes sp.]
MDWQDYIVWAIGLAVAALLVRRLRCFVQGRRKSGCASCDSTHCPLKAARRGHKTGRR